MSPLSRSTFPLIVLLKLHGGLGSSKLSRILKPGFLPSSPLARKLSALSQVLMWALVFTDFLSSQQHLELGMSRPSRLSTNIFLFAAQLINQRQIILRLFGFPLFQTTLLGCMDGVVESGSPPPTRRSDIDTLFLIFRTVIAIYLGVTIAARWKDGKAWTAILNYVPSVIGTILVATLPGTNKVGLLFSYWISSTFSHHHPTVSSRP